MRCSLRCCFEAVPCTLAFTAHVVACVIVCVQREEDDSGHGHGQPAAVGEHNVPVKTASAFAFPNFALIVAAPF